MFCKIFMALSQCLQTRRSIESIMWVPITKQQVNTPVITIFYCSSRPIVTHIFYKTSLFPLPSMIGYTHINILYIYIQNAGSQVLPTAQSAQFESTWRGWLMVDERSFLFGIQRKLGSLQVLGNLSCPISVSVP